MALSTLSAPGRSLISVATSTPKDICASPFNPRVAWFLAVTRIAARLFLLLKFLALFKNSLEFCMCTGATTPSISASDVPEMNNMRASFSLPSASLSVPAITTSTSVSTDCTPELFSISACCFSRFSLFFRSSCLFFASSSLLAITSPACVSNSF